MEVADAHSTATSTHYQQVLFKYQRSNDTSLFKQLILNSNNLKRVLLYYEISPSKINRIALYKATGDPIHSNLKQGKMVVF